jgi:SAM-dependent methyltransferase
LRKGSRGESLKVPPNVDLYNNAYGNYGTEIYRRVRLETYGEDFGQTSWVTNEESGEIPQLLGLSRESYVLEMGCGSGRYALHLAEKIGCRIVGLDVNEAGVCSANRLAQERGLTALSRFAKCDVSQKLPFEDITFDAVFSSDVFCHLPGRAGALAEIFRVLKRGGRLLFSDALVMGGMVSHEEIATRSSIGFYFYSPPGENERLLRGAGFCAVRATDTTENAARISAMWQQAREKGKTELVAIEGQATFDGLQRFLSCVHTLMSEKRLLRYLYTASKPL